jgi:hypothetical protein
MDETTPAPDWASPAHEIAVVRAALHAVVRDMLAGQAVPNHVLHDEQAVVDYYITEARGQLDRTP